MPDPTDDGYINSIVDQIIEEHARDKATHIVRKLTVDEIWIMNALEYYDSVEKAPGTGMLHRKSASKIMGMLSKCGDDALYQACLPGEVLGVMDTPRACFAQIARIILKRRGSQVAARILRSN